MRLDTMWKIGLLSPLLVICHPSGLHLVSMVSLRRRRLLGLCSAFVSGKDSVPVDLPKPIESEKHVEVAQSNVKPFSVHPLPLTKTSNVLTESLDGPDSLKEEQTQYYPGKEIKRRKRHRRKQYVDQEPCIMRGVYFKNMKWQAAIKVDKKQIHLGTVGTQDEAARLYDRAAFMCGREPNFELSEEEKQELQKYTWEDFLAVTRNTITSKKQRKVGLHRRSKADLFMGQSDGDTEMVNGGGSSNSDNGDVETLAS
ncbi:ethylene-responsive transcription factor-like protein At4g13040 isoform X3 [Phragmites australis]|uniref:ethylene-responsive transcription factor-like protein At4g13040 isoform X3 n=1 Tax=Phragmites australis TaxID=29695 RepID=UPI002D79DC4D|nr:ethylene-responsive transcription factor-like protein At4g13040 isoform X3 [Phragmites australis]